MLVLALREKDYSVSWYQGIKIKKLGELQERYSQFFDHANLQRSILNGIKCRNERSTTRE